MLFHSMCTCSLLCVTRPAGAVAWPSLRSGGDVGSPADAAALVQAPAATTATAGLREGSGGQHNTAQGTEEEDKNGEPQHMAALGSGAGKVPTPRPDLPRGEAGLLLQHSASSDNDTHTDESSICINRSTAGDQSHCLGKHGPPPSQAGPQVLPVGAGSHADGGMDARARSSGGNSNSTTNVSLPAAAGSAGADGADDHSGKASSAGGDGEKKPSREQQEAVLEATMFAERLGTL